MIKGSTEHEAHKNNVLKQAEDDAVAKFAAVDPIANPQEGIDALVDIKAARGLTQREERMLWGLIQLVVYRLLPNKEALQRRITA